MVVLECAPGVVEFLDGDLVESCFLEPVEDFEVVVEFLRAVFCEESAEIIILSDDVFGACFCALSCCLPELLFVYEHCDVDCRVHAG